MPRPTGLTASGTETMSKGNGRPPVHVKLELKFTLWARVKVFLGVRPLVVVELERGAKGTGPGKASAMVLVGPLFGRRKQPEGGADANSPT